MTRYARSQTHVRMLDPNGTHAPHDVIVTPAAVRADSSDNLAKLVAELDALAGRMTGEAVTDVITRSRLHIDDVTAFIATTSHGYSRRRVARTEAFEVLVMTWLPGQGSGAHDHAGSISAFKILGGTAHETRYEQAADSLVEPAATHQWHAGDVGIDAGDTIHAVQNDSLNELLVSIHVYSPPIAELRRFTVRQDAGDPADAFQRRRSPRARTVAILGGGFSGAMAAVQLLCKTQHSSEPSHMVIIDRQTSIAEGAAYRTPDASHLLNVPASGMSAWPDRPDDFLQWARYRDSSVGPYTFVQRRTYGEYLRATLFAAIGRAGVQTSVEFRRQEADTIERGGERGWRVHCSEGESIEADIVVLATGHRPPVDPLKQRWTGSRARYIEEPWSSLALTAIEADESVCLLGTGLTAIDVLQCMVRSPRSAPVVALSRRGLLPAAHASTPLAPIDPVAWLEPLLHSRTGTTTGAIARRIRNAVLAAESNDQDWRQVIDGLRPYISQLWKVLPMHERNRFLRHARPFWEVTRHRMAPSIVGNVRKLQDGGTFKTAAARILFARGSQDGVTLTVRRRGESVPETLNFDWIVNCTGPGSGREFGLPPVIQGLCDAGLLQQDPLGLGIHSTPNGNPIVNDRVIDDLVVIGSLRKADVWESTAVPELRLQASLAAQAIIAIGKFGR